MTWETSSDHCYDLPQQQSTLAIQLALHSSEFHKKCTQQ